MAKTIPALSLQKRIADGEKGIQKRTVKVNKNVLKPFREDSQAVFINEEKTIAQARLKFHLLVDGNHRTITFEIPININERFISEKELDGLLNGLCDTQKYLDIVGKLED